MVGVALGEVYLPGKGRGTAFHEPEHPRHLTVLIKGTYYFVARERVRFVK